MSDAGEWYWCLHCERASLLVDPWRGCGYVDCGGHVYDLTAWAEMRLGSPPDQDGQPQGWSVTKPHWPVVPVVGVRYPLYE